MSPQVCVIPDTPLGPWRIRAGRGNALLFGGVSFAQKKDAFQFIDSANKKVGSRRWTVKRSKIRDDRQLSLFDLFWPGRSV